MNNIEAVAGAAGSLSVTGAMIVGMWRYGPRPFADSAVRVLAAVVALSSRNAARRRTAQSILGIEDGGDTQPIDHGEDATPKDDENR